MVDLGPIAEHRPFRFGVLTFGESSAGALRELARRAEALGYSTLSFDEHMDRALSPIPAMLCAAEATERLRIGSCVFANDFRQPTLLAKDIASVDVLSGGRVEFGLGTGYAPVDYEQVGVVLDPPGVRVSRLEEAIRLIKAAFAGGPVSFDGEHYQVKDFALVPRPTQRPRPPLLLGGGSRRILSLAAREADIVGLNLRTTPEGGMDFTSVTPEATLEKVGWIRAAAGARFDAIELQLLVSRTTITNDPRAAAAQMRAEWGLGDVTTVDDVLATPHTLIGSEATLVEQLCETRERYGVSYFTVLAPSMDAFAPIVARLAGR